MVLSTSVYSRIFAHRSGEFSFDIRRQTSSERKLRKRTTFNSIRSSRRASKVKISPVRLFLLDVQTFSVRVQRSDRPCPPPSINGNSAEFTSKRKFSPIVRSILRFQLRHRFRLFSVGIPSEQFSTRSSSRWLAYSHDSDSSRNVHTNGEWQILRRPSASNGTNGDERARSFAFVRCGLIKQCF